MNFVKGITCLAFILLIFCCKKKDPPESVYMLERDNKTQTIVTNTSTPTNTVIVPLATYQPTAADTIVAVFECTKWRYFSRHSGGYFFYTTFYCYDGQIPLTVDSLLKRPPRKMDSTMIHIAQNDSNDMWINYAKSGTTPAIYSLHSTKGYPNCIRGNLPFSCGVCSWNTGASPYSIGYNGDPNTDRIYSQGNGTIAVGTTQASIKPYSCSSQKECKYSIYFENYTYFKINEKWFVWINRLRDYSVAGN